MKRFKLTENQYSMLCEEGSVCLLVRECSIEVTKCLNDVFDEDRYSNEWTQEYYIKTNDGIISKNILFKRFELSPNEVILEKIPTLTSIVMNVFYVDDIDEYGALYNQLNVGGNFKLYDDLVEIFVPCINGELRINMVRQYLLHELNHAYQYSLAVQGDYKKLLARSNNYMGQFNDDGNVVYSAARLIYFFNPMEIDAKMQELYDDLELLGIKNRFELDKTSVIDDKNRHIEKYYNGLKSANMNELNILIPRFFKITVDKLFEYLDGQINYFNKKVMRVYQYYVDKHSIKDILEIKSNQKIYLR